jgi:hypothetical protein
MATQTNSRSSAPTRRRSGRAQRTRDNVLDNAKSAGAGIGSVAQKAKGPALAGGAAMAGLIGGLVLRGRTGPKRVLGVPLPGTQRPLVKLSAPRRRTRGKDLVKAAGEFGELASELRLAREELEAKRRRSPIEVVLDGLTHRPPK